jgi:hypothetical protein
MPLSPFFSTAPRRQWALAYAKDLLRWLYTAFDDPVQCRLEFWQVLTGLSRRQAEGRARAEIELLMDHSRKWDMSALQRHLREQMTALLSAAAEGQAPAIVGCPRRLVACGSTRQGRRLSWRPVLPTEMEPGPVATYLLDEVLSDLSGVAVEAIGHCARCQHYFIRRRAGRGEYCSVECQRRTWSERQARPARRGRPPGRGEKRGR